MFQSPEGSWAMTRVGSTGCYLGINDGYFFYDGNCNWVYCYCHPCWQRRILTCDFVSSLPSFQTTKDTYDQYTQLSSEVSTLQTRKSQIPEDVTNKTLQLAWLTQNIDNLQADKNSLTANITSLHQQLTQLQQKNDQTTQEIDELKERNAKLNQELCPLQQQQQNMTTELETLERYHSTLKQQAEAIMNSSGFAQLKQIMASLSEEETKILKDCGIYWEIINSGFKNQLKESVGRYLDELCNQFKKYPIKINTNRIVYSFTLKLFRAIAGHIRELEGSIQESKNIEKEMEERMKAASFPEEVILSSLGELELYTSSLLAKSEKWNQILENVGKLCQCMILCFM